MVDTFKFYTERAEAAATAAENTTLENVRERELRAERTWRGLAQKAQAVAVQRKKVERDVAERKAAEKAAEAQSSAESTWPNTA